MIDLSHAFSLERWRRRFKSERDVAREYEEAGRAPDASVEDEVPVTRPATGNGQGSGDPGGPGWAGWGA